MRIRTSGMVLYILLSAGALVSMFPFMWMLSTALKSQVEATRNPMALLPAEWHWDNFPATFRAAPFATYFFNSFVVAFAVTAGVVLTSMAAGYAFARLEFAGKRLLFGLVLATMMIPFEVTLIPNFLIISRFGWYNTYAALIVPWCANAFSIFLMRQAFLSLPNDYFDAANLDGCGHFRFLAWIAAPLVRPMMVTVGLFAFLGSYNALIWPIVVTADDRMRVVQYGLTVFWSEAGVDLPLLMCASAIVILPTVAVYFAAQRYFLESAVSAGIKG
jgi:multiple sugar transport system permease protein